MSLYDKDLYVAYKIIYDGDDIPEDELENYVTGIWVQYASAKRDPIHYLPTDCESVPFIAQSSKYDRRQLEGMKCADMQGDHIRLYNSLTGKVSNGDFFYLMIDTCENLS